MSDNYIIKTLQGDPHEVFAAAPDMEAYRCGGLNWGMSNPIYREWRKQECVDIVRTPIVVPTSVLRRGGDATLKWFRRESFDLGLRRESARAMLRYIEHFEEGLMSQRECEGLCQKLQMAVEGMRAAMLAWGRGLKPALERATEQLREFGAAMERALEEDQQRARFVQPHTDGARVPAPSRSRLRGYGDRRVVHPGRGRDRSRG